MKKIREKSRKIFTWAILLFAVWTVAPAETEAAAKVQQVSLGNRHSAALLSDGSLWMWGDNGYGQLGDKTTVDRSKPVKVLENVKEVSLGGYHSAAIKTDGSLWMWGDNGSGQLGDGTRTGRSKPVKVLDNVKGVSLGGYHSAAIKTDGSLWMWGDNGSGQLGDGTTTDRNKPVNVLENVNDISLGTDYSAAIKTDGSLWMWGRNTSGQLGDGTTTNRNKPVNVLENVKEASLGYRHSAAIKTDGSLWMWGDNAYGELGDGTTKCKYKPEKVLDYVISVSLGDEYSAAVKTDGSLWQWGCSGGYEYGGRVYRRQDNTPLKKELKNVKSVILGCRIGRHWTDASWAHSAIIMADGNMWMWGKNDCGELGDGTTRDRFYVTDPFRVEFGTDISKAAVTLENEQMIYSGSSTKTPEVKVVYGGKTLEKSKDFLAVYSNASTIGQASVTITGLGDYTGSVKAKYKVVPDTPTVFNGKSKNAGEASFTWAKVSGADGYEIRYYKKGESSAKTTLKFYDKSVKIKNLAGGETYIFQARAYKNVNGKDYYSAWTSKYTLKIMADTFVYKKGKYYYEGGDFNQKSYELDAPLVVEKAMSVPDNTTVTAKSICVKAKTNLGKYTYLVSNGIFEVKTVGSLSMARGSKISVADNFAYSPSGAAAVSTLSNGTISVSGDVTIKSKFQTSKGSVLELTGTKKTKVSCGKGCSIACLYLKSVSLDKLELSGKGSLNGIKFNLSLDNSTADLSKQFSFSAPTNGKKRDKAIEQTMSNALFSVLFSNAYVGKDLLADFYGGFKGVAIYNKSEFAIPVMVKRRSTYEYGTVSGKMQGLGKLMFGTITYTSGNIKYQVVCSPTLKTSNSAVKAFMKKMRAGAAKEVAKQAKNCLKSEFLGCLKGMSKEFSWSKGLAFCEFESGKKTFDSFKGQLKGWVNLNQSIEKKWK